MLAYICAAQSDMALHVSKACMVTMSSVLYTWKFLPSSYVCSRQQAAAPARH